MSRGSGASRPGVLDGPAECGATGGASGVVLRSAVAFVASVARGAFGVALEGAVVGVGGWAEGSRVVLAGTDGKGEPHASRHTPSMTGIERQDTTTTIGVMTATA
ncbi:MAG: hypothetical protein VB934_09030 [Polyangiaceae bacterium]